MVTLERLGAVHVLHLGDGDNRFNVESISAINAAFDEVEAVASREATALVTTASGKVWHNGLDLAFMATLGGDLAAFIGTFQAVLARTLKLPVFTVAAMQGHVFAGGGFLALAHDVRIMREDRGWFCLPEVDLGMFFGVGLGRLCAAKLPQPALHRLAVMGERLTGPEAVALGVVDAVASEDQVLDIAIERASALAARSVPTLATIRRDFYGAAIVALEQGLSAPSDGTS